MQSTPGVKLRDRVMAAVTKPRRDQKHPRPSRDELVKNIMRFVEKHGTVRQHTRQWHALLLETVGGSELGALFGLNKKKTRKELIEEKRHTREWETPIPCIWGTLFEPVIRAYVEFEQETVVYGHDICIQNGRFRLSPDGLCVIQRPRGNDLFDIALIEIKCPYIRWPKDKVPPYYEPQVLAGLAVTEELKPAYGLYVDVVIRKCGKDQFDDTPDYDRRYHSKGYPSYCQPKAWGMFCIRSSRCDDIPTKPVDYGAADREVFDGMLRDLDKGVVNASLVYLTFADEEARSLSHQQHSPVDGMHIIGYLPFKIVHVFSKKIKPIQGYGAYVIESVNNFFNEVDVK